MLFSGGHNEDATAVDEICGRGTRIQRGSRRPHKGNCEVAIERFVRSNYAIALTHVL